MREFLRQNLDGDIALQMLILSAINDAHTARSEYLENAVMG